MAPEPSGVLRASLSTATIAKPRMDDGISALRYEHTVAAKAPIPVTVPPPRSPPTDTHPALRTGSATSREELDDPTKRDSGLAPVLIKAPRDNSVEGIDLAPGAQKTALQTREETSPKPEPAALPKSESTISISRWLGTQKRNTESRPPALKLNDDAAPLTATEEDFSPITTPIPTDEQLELDFMDQLSFSNRGSVLLGGKKAINTQLRASPSRRKQSVSMGPPHVPSLLSEEVELESQKVRSMYEVHHSGEWSIESVSAAGTPSKSDAEQCAPGSETPSTSPESKAENPRTSEHDETRPSTRQKHEMAGGLEDWEDVDGGDVDRYGFIVKRRESARAGDPEPRPGVQRTSTVLLMASEAPRRRRGLGRSASTSKSSRSTIHRNPSVRKTIGSPSINSQNTSASGHSPSRSKPFRSAANRLPGNRDRRWMDEAGDMLTLPPGLADIAEDEEGGRAEQGVKMKEWSRAEKWRKMARVSTTGLNGEGMEFDFDVRNPKLIERTWKGIPDRWRATAWHSFLSASARKVLGSPTEEDIIASFHKLVYQSSADDVQIDLDVPRTINSHIMFRKRYRGGQRLLFRVLHALSLYYPVTGYVQGMASLAATLLCYFDEEKTFVMLVRMWVLRGLDKLYATGFAGLMGALDEFQKEWLHGNDVSKQLDELSIEPTAYGTRWYLTLFNYSIPFPCQLRVWDVFMLLGDANESKITTERPFGGGLDVLHAASAALIDGTREILLDSDFENAMKVLTSWIPVKDEELFMRVAKAEWKANHGRKRSS